LDLELCHQIQSFLVNIKQNPKEITDTFRLFLSAKPAKDFPVTLLQESVKIVTEQAKGIRSNVREALAKMDSEFFESNGNLDFLSPLYCLLSFANN